MLLTIGVGSTAIIIFIHALYQVHKGKKEMAHIPDYWNRLIKENLSEYQRDRDGFGEFYIRDTDHAKIYTKEFDRWHDPYLELEKPDRKPKELKRKIDIDK